MRYEDDDEPIQARTPLHERVGHLENTLDLMKKELDGLRDELASLSNQVTFELGKP